MLYCLMCPSAAGRLKTKWALLDGFTDPDGTSCVTAVSSDLTLNHSIVCALSWPQTILKDFVI